MKWGIICFPTSSSLLTSGSSETSPSPSAWCVRQDYTGLTLGDEWQVFGHGSLNHRLLAGAGKGLRCAGSSANHTSVLELLGFCLQWPCWFSLAFCCGISRGSREGQQYPPAARGIRGHPKLRLCSRWREGTKVSVIWARNCSRRKSGGVCVSAVSPEELSVPTSCLCFKAAEWKSPSTAARMYHCRKQSLFP